MLNINDILYKYILEKYGSIADFSDYSGIPLIELNAILLKDNIPLDIRSGLILCKKLNIDIEQLVFGGEISEPGSNQSNFGNPNKQIKEAKQAKETEKAGIINKSNGSGENADGTVSASELRDRYMRLSEIEKREVIEFVNKIAERHE